MMSDHEFDPGSIHDGWVPDNGDLIPPRTTIPQDNVGGEDIDRMNSDEYTVSSSPEAEDNKKLWLALFGAVVATIIIVMFSFFIGGPQLVTTLFSVSMFVLTIYSSRRDRSQFEAVSWLVVAITAVVTLYTTSYLSFPWLLAVTPIVSMVIIIMLVANRPLRITGRLYSRTFLASSIITGICAIALSKGALAGLAITTIASLVVWAWMVLKPVDLIKLYGPVLAKEPTVKELPWSIVKYSEKSYMMTDATAYTRRMWVPALMPRLSIGLVWLAIGIAVIYGNIKYEWALPLWVPTILILTSPLLVAWAIYWYMTDYVVVTPAWLFSVEARPPQGDSPGIQLGFIAGVNSFRSIWGKTLGYINLGPQTIGTSDQQAKSKAEQRAEKKELKILNKPYRWVPRQSDVAAELARALLEKRQIDGPLNQR